MPKLFLFDIDGTLVDTGGAGLRAFARIFAEQFGKADALRQIPLAGRTDRAILADALALLAPDHEADEAWIRDFSERYVVALAEELDNGSPRKRLLPGVAETLDALEAIDSTHLALLTGNFRKGAEVKLGHFGIWTRFAFGAYGDDSEDRNDLFAVAIARARESGVTVSDPRDVVIVGDTPHDIACAQCGGAMSVGITTGPYDRTALREAGADEIIDDLRELPSVVFG